MSQKVLVAYFSASGVTARVAQDMAQYDTVFIGFPIWWYVEPRIVDTFLESYDFAGKKLIPFATHYENKEHLTYLFLLPRFDGLQPGDCLCGDQVIWSLDAGRCIRRVMFDMIKRNIYNTCIETEKCRPEMQFCEVVFPAGKEGTGYAKRLRKINSGKKK